MVKGLKIGAVVALVMVLAGCGNDGSAQTENEPVGFANVQPETDATPEASATPEPLVAETPAATEPLTTGTPEEQFVERAKFYLDIDPSNNQVPHATDEQLIDAGNKACERLRAGEAIYGFSVIEGETQVSEIFWTSGQIAIGASETLCADQIQG